MNRRNFFGMVATGGLFRPSTGRSNTSDFLDPRKQPKFVSPLPNPLHPDFIFESSGNHYQGLPNAWFTPHNVDQGRLCRHVYTYDNHQEAGTLWHHNHALGITRLNVYAGLAGEKEHHV